MIQFGKINPKHWSKQTLKILIKLIEESPMSTTELAKEHSGDKFRTLSSIRTLKKAGVPVRKKCVSNESNKNKITVWYIK